MNLWINRVLKELKQSVFLFISSWSLRQKSQNPLIFILLRNIPSSWMANRWARGVEHFRFSDAFVLVERRAFFWYFIHLRLCFKYLLICIIFFTYTKYTKSELHPKDIDIQVHIKVQYFRCIWYITILFFSSF